MNLTIATPTFGKPPFLDTCIASIELQTLKTKHIICGGNLSIDETKVNNHLQVIHKNPDPGMVKCWSLAASLAKTDYIGFLADDNAIESTYSQQLVDFLDNHPDCDLVFCNQYHMDGNGSIDHEKSLAFTNYFGRNKLPAGVIDEIYYEEILKRNSIPLEACIIRKTIWSTFGPFKEDAKGSFDQEFLYRLLLNKIKIGFIPEYLMRFRWHDAAYSSREAKDHLIGSIWTNEELKNFSKKYYAFFNDSSIALTARLLRYKLKPEERLKIIFILIRKRNGIKHVFKNSIAKVLGLK